MEIGIDISKADDYTARTLVRLFKEGNTTLGKKVRPKYRDGTPAHTTYINQVVETYDISKGEFPITTLRPINITKAIGEILWIYQDQSNDLDLLKNKYGITWWDEWEIGSSRTIGKRYGNTVAKYDLMNKLLNGLVNDPYSRRHIIDLYQYSEFEMSAGLYPCAYSTTWIVRDEYLDMTLHQRSSDYLVAGHINKMQYVALMMMVAKHVGLKPGNFMHVVDNLHIYDRHLAQAIAMMQRKPSNIHPTLVLDTDNTDFYKFKVSDFKLIGYYPNKPQLKFELGI